MKKILLSFLFFFLGIFSPLSLYAADEGTVYEGCGLKCGVDLLREYLVGSGIEIHSSLMVAILFYVKILLILSGTFAFIAFLWAGFLYITSFADMENHERAKKIILSAATGIIVILLSYILTDFFMNATVDSPAT